MNKKINIQIIFWLMICVIEIKKLAYASYTFDECNAVQKSSLRDQLHNISRQIFFSADKKLDIKRSVDTAWQAVDMNFIIDKAVDSAVRKVERDMSFLESFSASWSETKIKSLAEQVAKQTFEGEAFNLALEQVATGVTQQISISMEKVVAQSASASLMCLKTFIGDRYSTSVANALETTVSAGLQNNKIIPILPSSSIISTHSQAIMGAGLIVTSVIAKTLVKKVFQQIISKIAIGTVTKIAGKVIGILVPGIGWTLVVLDAYEYASSPSVVSVIGKNLKSQIVKEEIKTEVANTLQEQFVTQYAKVALQVADAIFDAWIDFKVKFRRVLELADNVPEFKPILNNTAKDDLLKLSNLVSFGLKYVSKEELIAAIKNGTFEEVLELPENALQILETTKSLTVVIAWNKFAGSKLEQVIALEVYKYKMPNELDKSLLNKLLEVNDIDVISKLAVLNKVAMEAMLTVSSNNLKRVSNMNANEMRCVSDYMIQIDSTNKANIIDYVVANSHAAKLLCDETVREKILMATDKSALIEFVVSPSNYTSAINDLLQIITQGIPLNVLLHKYDVVEIKIALAIIAAIFITLFILAIAKRRSQPHIIINVPESKTRDNLNAKHS